MRLVANGRGPIESHTFATATLLFNLKNNPMIISLALLLSLHPQCVSS